MNDTRYGGASAVLDNGDVVVAGGGMVNTTRVYLKSHQLANRRKGNRHQTGPIRYGPVWLTYIHSL
ncbi:hypothetical protein AV540_08165 [Brevibacillus parabrevis]|uniref:hypothetical protein n=1 Tax=Brevibacillus parabrevis TaxID=54914 RepID=UPI0007AB3E72|nr:hypothetical protein [Brevibacillus parabrevis]KZE53023.1 hypothetical protein AV540_08165 [Brevibacillus parabrevis]